MSEFNGLVEREIPRLRRYARALTRSADRADDLVQETLLRAISKSHLWQTGTDIRAWLFTIMHNHYVNMVRRAMRDEATIDIEQMSSSLIAITDPTASSQLRELEQSLGRLPGEQREVILLVGLEGMSYETAAKVLSVPVRTVRSRLSRGRDALRRLMGLPEDYVLPENYNEAYHLVGDGVVVPVIRFLAAHILEPILASRRRAK